jgi:hypothetical protein
VTRRKKQPSLVITLIKKTALIKTTLYQHSINVHDQNEDRVQRQLAPV